MPSESCAIQAISCYHIHSETNKVLCYATEHKLQQWGLWITLFQMPTQVCKKGISSPHPTPIQMAYLGHWERSTCILFLEQTPKKSKEKRRPASENSTKAHQKQAFVLCLERSPRLEACVQLKCFTHSLCRARLSNDPEGFPNLRGQFGSFH